MKKWFLVAVAFLGLGLLYLWPAPLQTTQGRLLGIGGDEVTMPYFLWWARELWNQAPASVFNGSLFSPQAGAPHGLVIWLGMMERFFAWISWPFLSPSAALTGLMIFLYALTGLLMTWVGRRMGLGWILSVSMGICLSFTPFTYWRSFQHIGLAGLFFLPLLVLAWDDLDRSQTKKDLLRPALLLLIAATTVPYLLIVLLTLIPGVLWLLRKKPRTFLAFLPMVIFIAWMRFFSPVGVSDLRHEAPLFDSPRPSNPHAAWDLMVYSAKPMDYLSGNFDHRSLDLNPLRQWITDSIRDRHGDQFYPQEHSAGVRWFLLVLFVMGIWFFRRMPSSQRRWMVLGFVIFGIGYFCSLSPRSIAPLGIGMGPSRWIHEWIPEMRAPNRWCVAAHLGVILVAFSLLRFWSDRLPRQATWGILALSFLEFLPTMRVPTRPQIEPIGKESPCGLGVFLPYRNNTTPESYRQLTSLRFSDCRILNGHQTPDADRYLQKVLNGPNPKELLHCLGVQWVRFDEAPTEVQCLSLGFGLAMGIECSEPLVEFESPGWAVCTDADSAR